MSDVDLSDYDLSERGARSLRLALEALEGSGMSLYEGSKMLVGDLAAAGAYAPAAYVVLLRERLEDVGDEQAYAQHVAGEQEALLALAFMAAGVEPVEPKRVEAARKALTRHRLEDDDTTVPVGVVDPRGVALLAKIDGPPKTRSQILAARAVVAAREVLGKPVPDALRAQAGLPLPEAHR